MAKLFDLNKKIIPTSEKLSNSSSRDAVSLNSKRVRDDINRISNYINSVIVPTYSSLTSDLKFPYDVVEWGFSGETIVTWPESLGNNYSAHPMFWKVSSEIDIGRPCTIKESFDWVIDNFTSRIIEIQESSPDLNDIYELIQCNLLKVEQLKKEVLTEKYVLECRDAPRRYEYTLSTHVYNIIHQLTTGMNNSYIGPYNDSEPAYPTLNIPYEVISGRVQSIFDLIDVDLDVEKNQTHPNEGQILQWQWSSNGNGDPEGDGGDGFFAVVDMPEIPSSLNDLEDVDVTNANEGDALVRLNDGTWGPSNVGNNNNTSFVGSGLDVRSTVNDIVDGIDKISSFYNISEEMNSLLEVLQALPEQNEEILNQIFQIIFDSYSSGAQLNFDGKGNWHPNLGGNISNLNKISLVPEIFTKGASYLNGLNDLEKIKLVSGGYRMLPFTFINSFNINLKNKLDQNFWRIQFNPNLGEVPLTSDSNLNILRNATTEERIGDILNSLPNRKYSKMQNEIESEVKIKPLGSTRTSTIFTNNESVNELYYEPNLLLGVARNDLEEIAAGETTLGLDAFFEKDLEGNIALREGVNNPSNINFAYHGTLTSLDLGKVQHSGYSRIMVVGPHKIGDQIYLCPEPILKAAGINYPFGICISETFLNTPIKEILSLSNEGFSTTYPILAADGTKTIYELIRDGDTSYNPEALLTDKLYNKIISCPVGFITRCDSPRKESSEITSISIENNTAHTLCKTIMGNNHDNTENNGYDRISNYLESLSTDEFGNWITNSLFSEPYDDIGATFITEVFCLNLPYCKIQISSLKYSAEILDKEIPDPIAIPALEIDGNNNLSFGDVTVGRVGTTFIFDKIEHFNSVPFSGKGSINNNEIYEYKNNFLEETGFVEEYILEGLPKCKILSGSISLNFIQTNNYDLTIRVRGCKKQTGVLSTDLVTPIYIEQESASLGRNVFAFSVAETFLELENDDIALTFETSESTPVLNEILTDLNFFLRVKYYS